MDENIVALIQTISGILQTIAVLVTLIILIKQYKKFTHQHSQFLSYGVASIKAGNSPLRNPFPYFFYGWPPG